MLKSTEVVAAIVRREGKLLVCRRPANKARPLLWEFVGGKVEPGESKRQALVRECREEIGVTVSVGDVFAEVVHRYPDVCVRLTFFNCTILQGEPRLLEHSDMKWVLPEETDGLEFCPADESVLQKLKG